MSAAVKGHTDSGSYKSRHLTEFFAPISPAFIQCWPGEFGGVRRTQLRIDDTGRTVLDRAITSQDTEKHMEGTVG